MSYVVNVVQSPSFESRQVVRLVGIPERTLRYLADRGVVVPELADAVGRPGIRRRYSFRNLIEWGVVEELLGYGINLREVRGILRFLRRSGMLTLWPTYCFLVVQEGEAVGVLADPDTMAQVKPSVRKWIRPLRHSPKESVGALLEQMIETGEAGDSVLVVAVHRIRDRLAARTGVHPKPA